MKIVRWLVLGSFAVAASATAADNAGDARLRDQLRQTTMQLRQLQDDNAAMKAKIDSGQCGATAAAPKADADDVAKLKKELQQAQAHVAALQKQVDAQEASIATWKKSYEDVTNTARAKTIEAQRLDQQAQQASAETQRTTATLQSCVSHNAELVKVADELVIRYKEKGVWSALRDKEPVLGVSHVEFEKIAQEYRGRIADATVSAAPTENAQ